MCLVFFFPFFKAEFGRVGEERRQIDFDSKTNTILSCISSFILIKSWLNEPVARDQASGVELCPVSAVTADLRLSPGSVIPCQ